MSKRKRPSIADVARLAKVSNGTVSNIFNQRRSTDDAIAIGVKKAAEKLGYEPNRAASLLRSGASRIVVAIVPDIQNPYFSAILAKLESLARHDGYDLIIGSSNDDESLEASRLSALLAWNPVGLIAIPCTDHFPGFGLIEDAGAHCIIVDRLGETVCADTVSIDNRGAGAAGANHLIDLGHTEIVVVATSLDIKNMRERIEGARVAAEARGIDNIEIVEAGTGREESSEKLSSFFQHSRKHTGVLAMTNWLTLAVLSSTIKCGLDIPNDVSLVGFDDYEWMLARKTPITAFSQPTDDIANVAWERLKARINGDTAAPSNTSLEGTLQVRQSTAPPGSPVSLATDITPGPLARSTDSDD